MIARGSREEGWREANQDHLVAAIGTVRAVLARHAGAGKGGPEGPAELEAARELLAKAAAGLPAPSALERLCGSFALSPFERDILLCCAGMELLGRFASECAAAHRDPRRPHPTFGLMLAALPEPHWSALTPMGSLRRWRLIEVLPGDTLTSSPLRIDERVLHYLTGISFLDPRLQELALPVPDPGELPASQREVAARIERAWAPGADAPVPCVIQLCGTEPEGIAAHACGRLGLRLHRIRAGSLPGSAADREELMRLWEREALLEGSGLLLECDDGAGSEALRAAAAFAEQVRSLVLIAGREPLPLHGRPVLRLDVRRPLPAEQRALWQRALGPLAPGLNGQLERLVAQFNLGAQAISSASAEARARGAREDGDALGAMLWDACRTRSRPRLEDLAQRLEPSSGWDDLVLPDGPRETLREIAANVRQRSVVYGGWGFGAKDSRGLGLSALFAGASGTGKTLAAEVLARELRLDLYRIDLSQVVSKYIGETEKNLRRVFEAAEEGGAILLFDEADALFGKRSEVKDSHDRYANIEVSYLLQRMEAYSGLALLTTNMKAALDPAFLRRIRFVVQFPFPDLAQRTEIWRRMFPPATPTDGLDVGRLARLNLAGGNIRTIALSAAFLAADAGEPVRMSHLLRAARTEYAKLEKPLSEAELAGWS